MFLCLLLAAINYLDSLGVAADVIVNHVLEADAQGGMRLYPLAE